MAISTEVSGLRKFIEDNGFSVRDAAAAMGLHRDTLYGWMNRGASPKPENIAQIRNFIGGSKATKNERSKSTSKVNVGSPTSSNTSLDRKSLMREAVSLTARLHEIQSVLSYTE